MNRIKALLAALLAVLLWLVARGTYYVSTATLTSLYTDVYFTRLAVEAQRFTRQIEYGIENGKSLDNFYNINSILTEVRRCSSYINGAYILSADYTLLYSLAEEGEPPLQRAAVMSDSRIYSYLADGGERYLISVPIYGKDDVPSGFMVLNVRREAVDNIVAQYARENLVQSAGMAVLAFLAGLALLIRLRRKESVYRTGARVITAAVCGCVTIDGALSTLKFYLRIESIIQQSVSKITMALQNDLLSVQEKGAQLSKIYDLNTWLMTSCDEIPFIDNLIYDKNYKITAILSENYIWQQTLFYAAGLIAVLGLCIAGGALFMLLARFADKYRAGLTMKKKTGDKAHI